MWSCLHMKTNLRQHIAFTGGPLAGALSWYCYLVILLCGEFSRLVASKTVSPQPPSTMSSDWSVSSRGTRWTAPTTGSPSSGDTGRNRLDFISVAVICGVVAFCFLICVIIGCRRKKQRRSLPRCEDMASTIISPSTSASDGNILRTAAGNTTEGVENLSPGALRRRMESPPPTYSVIERQTSFSSYVSQTSSMIEIPPDYDDAWNPDTSTETEASQISQASSGRRIRTVRSASSRGNGTKKPPPARSAYRSYSDADGRRRMRARPGSLPSTVSEDEGGSEFNTTARSIDVIIEVNQSASSLLEHPSEDNSVINESSQPLIKNSDQNSGRTVASQV